MKADSINERLEDAMYVTELELQVSNQLKVLQQFEKLTNLVTLRFADLLNKLIKSDGYENSVNDGSLSAGGD